MIKIFNTNNLEIVDLFVKRGINLTDNIYYNNYSFLHYLIIQNQPNERIIQYFIEQNGKINITDIKRYKNFINKLKCNGSLQPIKFLINIKEKDFIQNFVKNAIVSNHYDVLNILFKNNLNIELKVIDGGKKITLWKYIRSIK